MSKPKRQHFIPKSYLKNFADIDGGKAFVEVMNVNSGEVKYPFSLSNVCVSKNIYTLPHVDEKNKYFVEHFYAENIDGVYPEVYDLLTNHKVINISEDERNKILNVCLSLYFRNAKFLDDKNDELDFWINRLKEKKGGRDDAKLFINFGGRRYDFQRSEIDFIKDTAILNNRIDFIFDHLQDWQNFVHFKRNSQIVVSKILGEVKLITSDNPVRVSNHNREHFNLFDPDNSIQIPLDQEHLLWISPNDEEVPRNMINRGVRDKWFAITSNHTMRQDASDWIIGKKGCITKYLEEDRMYNNFNPENLQALDDIKTIATELAKFVDFARSNGGITSEKSLQTLRQLKKIPAIANDPQFKLLCLELMINGYSV